MTLYVKNGKFRLRLFCPIALCGKILKSYIKKTAAQNGVDISEIGASVKTVVKELRAAKKYFGNIELLSVDGADGTRVVIKL